MEKYLFIRAALDLLAQDRFLCRAVAISLKLTAVLLVLLSLSTFFVTGKLIFDLPPNGILGGVLFEALFVLAVYAAAHVLFIRGEQIQALAPGQYIALRIAPLLVRALGEAYAGYVGLIAIGGGVFVWFTNLKLIKVISPVVHPLFPSVGDEPSFVGGISFMLTGLAAAAGMLLIAYIAAEMLTLWARPVKAVEPARNGADERFRSRVGY
jgi:hypothetical protein